ncbi:hypothetical protein AMECASPLE_018318 [Ameca splendens]|uniref:Uncharacterized protein n=1 Tax=Ameca splendens TaxID=208324 RepID=A0ABV0XRM6_9TELE
MFLHLLHTHGFCLTSIRKENEPRAALIERNLNLNFYSEMIKLNDLRKGAFLQVGSPQQNQIRLVSDDPELLESKVSL